MPLITRRIRAISSEEILAWCSTFLSGWTTSPQRRFLLKVFFRHFVSAISEQKRMIVLFFHADCLRGGNCRSLLLNGVLLFSIEAFSQSPFTADVLPFLTLDPYSWLNPYTPDLEVLCSDHLINVSSYHCLQLLITWRPPVLIYFLFIHCFFCMRHMRTLLCDMRWNIVQGWKHCSRKRRDATSLLWPHFSFILCLYCLKLHKLTIRILHKLSETLSMGDFTCRQ